VRTPRPTVCDVASHGVLRRVPAVRTSRSTACYVAFRGADVASHGVLRRVPPCGRRVTRCVTSRPAVRTSSYAVCYVASRRCNRASRAVYTTARTVYVVGSKYDRNTFVTNRRLTSRLTLLQYLASLGWLAGSRNGSGGS